MVKMSTTGMGRGQWGGVKEDCVKIEHSVV